MGSPLSRRLNKPAEETRRPPAEVRPLDAPPPPPAPAAEKATDDTSAYIPPPKRRTTPRVADLRRQLRPKLLAAPNEADEWRRDNPEHQKIIVDRLNVFLQRANLQLPKPEFDELREALLDDILGWGAIDPLVRDRSYSEIMVNGPEIIFAEKKGKLVET